MVAYDGIGVFWYCIGFPMESGIQMKEFQVSLIFFGSVFIGCL
jgi:hypothetical protein